MQLTIQNLPKSAGVYQYFNKDDKLLYIGKAKNLKSRVKSYWHFRPSFSPNPNLSYRIVKMLEETSYLKYIVVETEDDALVLENSLIKQLNPKYNILLRDDKTYPYIMIDMSKDFARFEITREIKTKQNKYIKYYGPFPTGAKSLIDSLYEIYPLVQSTSCLRGKKACLFYQIKKCLAPCEGKISAIEYKAIIEEAKASIHKPKALIDKLHQKMMLLSTQERYEEALKIREDIKALSSLSISCNIELVNLLDCDIWVIKNGDKKGVILKLFMRQGKIISSDYSYFRQTHLFNLNENYTQALLSFYHENIPNIPKEIIISHTFSNSQSVSNILSKRFKKKILLSKPKIGNKFKLITLALKNAKELLKNNQNQIEIQEYVADLFELSSFPYKVESFDNSHLMGVACVGAMVVNNENNWDKSAYRRYILKEKSEYEQMREMLSRRIESFKKTPPPDLWILDGGIANLNLATKLLKEAQINLDVIAISKEKRENTSNRSKGKAKDIIYTNQQVFTLSTDHKVLHWVQNQRDEAHRYAIAYHQKRKREADKQVSLLHKKGIGEATIKKLIHYFGTFENINKASKEEIRKVTNNKISIIIKDNNTI